MKKDLSKDIEKEWEKELENVRVMPKKFLGEDYEKLKKKKKFNFSRLFLWLVIIIVGLGLIGGGAYIFFVFQKAKSKPESKPEEPIVNKEVVQPRLTNEEMPLPEKKIEPEEFAFEVKDKNNKLVGSVELSLYLPKEINKKDVSLAGMLPSQETKEIDPDYEIIGPVYNIIPQNIQLEKKSKITLTYIQEDIKEDLEDSLQVAFLVNNQWQPIKTTVDKTGNKAVGEIDEFPSTNFTLIIRKSLLEKEKKPEGLLINIPSPSTLDSDEDGLTDKEEELYGTDPHKPDTDKDSYPDGLELINLYNPLAGAGAKLAISGLINSYTNPIYNYTLYYPAGWLVRALDETNREVMFTSATGEFIEVIVQDNPRKISLETWYREQFPEIDLSQIRKTLVDNKDAIWSLDGQTIYIGTPDNIYSLTYNSGKEEKLNFKTTFEMMIRSFKLPSLSEVQIQSNNDATRLSDIQMIQTALETYFRDEGKYPESLISGESIKTEEKVYLPTIPSNPQPGGIPYEYQSLSDGQSYKIRFKLEVGTGDYDAGYYLASPGKIENVEEE